MKCNVEYTIAGTRKRIECDNIATAVEMTRDLMNVSSVPSVTISPEDATPAPIDISEARLLDVFRTLNPNNRQMLCEMAAAIQRIQNGVE